MTRPAILLLALLALVASPASAAGDGIGRLRWDGTTLRAGERVVPAPADLAGKLDSLRAAVLDPHLDPGPLARDVAAIVLAPLEVELAPHERWVVHPPLLAPLELLPLPWAPGERVLDRHVVVYATGPGLGQGSREAGDLLALAPFHPGLEPAHDDPDTVIWALRPQLRRVRLLPRNDSTPERALAALDEIRPALAWLRARPALAGPWVELLAPTPALWSWPAPGAPTPELWPQLLELAGGAPALAPLWPLPDPAAARFAEGFTTRLAAGQGFAAAATATRRELAATRPVAEWAGTITLGDAHGHVVPLRRPGFLQRLFPRKGRRP